MSHPEQSDFINRVKTQYPDFFKNKKVLEIGSLDINGSARHFFESCEYTGIDVGDGPGVDIVCQGQEFDAPDGEYDTVFSAECFEHNPYWLETFQNMLRICKDGGLVFFTCATHGREEHGTTRSMPEASPLTVGLEWDYYRNLDESDFTNKINFEEHFEKYNFETRTTYPQDLYFVGIKKSLKKKFSSFNRQFFKIHFFTSFIKSLD